ncbi:hypothetical protein NX059_000413 [Plenodomus lindquistii]|nr:hypothetical protein NX059_000413 [Plenodomus lindquistii]
MSNPAHPNNSPQKHQHLNMPDAAAFTRQHRRPNNNNNNNNDPQAAQVPPSRLPYPVYDYAGSSHQHARTYVSRIPVRQATTIDYTRKIHPLPLPPVSDHSSDQNLSSVEPGMRPCTCFDYNAQMHNGLVSRTSETALNDVRRRPSTTTTNAANIGAASTSEVSQGANATQIYSPVTAAQNARSTSAEYNDSLDHMPEDEFSAVMGGLHSLSNIQHKESRRERTKRFFKGLKRGISGRRG